MSDDLDDLLRRTMKTLDDQVPSGYFEGLPNRTLARLGEDSSMQTSTGTTSSDSGGGVPPQQDRDEDSGLHDIRSMASSTKMRLSSRRISQPPPVDDDILASSSAGWKAVALPEPAKMVSLPELPVAPAASERSKKTTKTERTSAKKVAKDAIAIETAPVAATVSEPAADAAVTPIIGARFAQQKKSKGGLYAMVGVALAAAAGVGWYVSTQMTSDSKSSAQVAMEDTTERAAAQPVAATPPPAPAAIAAPEPAEEKATETGDETVATGMAAESPAADDADGADDDGKARRKGPAKKDKRDDKDDKVVIDLNAGKKTPPPADKPAEPKTEKPAGGSGEGAEPSFDQLLKEAGVQEQKPKQPKLEKKSLSSGDIKTGMNGVEAKALACYAGQQGTAVLKLTVAPTGEIQKVKVSGVFAGTPVGACVERAVRSAKFPPWDGGPQSFGYSYLLAE